MRPSDESAPTQLGTPGLAGLSSADLNAPTMIGAPAARAPLPPHTLQPTAASARGATASQSGVTNAALAKKSGGGGTPQPGDYLRHYELIRLLGKGGMGSVFLARDTKLGRKVAIKFLSTKNRELTQRFVIEARATARCSHENIVIIYEADEVEGRPYMVLEYLQGHPLTKLVNRAMAPGRAVELMVPVVRALACAHEQGIVHRDLKPDNIFVTDSGTIKVLDFGIAKVLQGDESEGGQGSGPALPAVDSDEESAEGGEGLTRHGAIMGTLLYMSPEQWGIGVSIDHRTDIWAVGIMLFRLLSGRHPLQGLEGMALSVTGRLTEPMPKLRDVAPSVPPELCDVVDRCLLKKKEERFPDALALLRALEPYLPGRFHREIKIDESPYAGLASFQEADAGRFFGRNHEIAALVNKVREQPMCAVVGPSGAGKSSFVRAGLMPALKRSGEAWDTAVIRPGRTPLASLAAIVAPMLNTSNSVSDDLREQNQLIERMRAEPGFVGSVLRSRARRDKRAIVLFVDQFEELYTLVPDAAERLAFTACLSGIADDPTSPTRVVLSLRSDFLDRVCEDQRFMADLGQRLFFLSAPNRDGLRDALVQPAEMAGYRFESAAVVEDMLSHLQSTQGALPLLQFTASKLWESRDPARHLLTEASYKAIGGIAGALASHADAVVAKLPPPSRNLVRAIFLRLVTPERTRAIVSSEELRELSRDAAEVERLVDQLVQARLLVVNTTAGGATIELVHESLIHTWPTLRRWLDESGEDAAFLEQLRNAARQWQAKGQDAGLLWRGEMVEEARRFQRRYRGELPAAQQKFLESVFSAEQKSARRKRAATVGGLVFLSLLVAASFVALVVIRNAQQEAVRQADVATKAESTARKAESEARQRLIEVQEKERERAEAARKAEEAAAQVQSANAELQGKNQQLIDAVRRAEEARQRANTAQQGAEKNATVARLAREEAIRAARDLQTLLKREQERAQRLENQLGSPVIESLK